MKKAFSLLMLSLIAVSLLNSLGQIPINITPPSEDSEHKVPMPNQTSTQTGDEAEIAYTGVYESLIARWKFSMIQHNNGEQTTYDIFNFHFYSDSSADASAYYSLYDIDGNSIPELILRKVCGYEDIISYIFTIKDGVPTNLFGHNYGTEVPWSRHGSAKILSNGLIDCTDGNNSIYKIADDGYTLIQIASSEPYDYPDEAGLAEADWKYYINGAQVDYDFYVQYLNEQGYLTDKDNDFAVIEWTELESAMSTTTQRVCESMPEYTIHRMIGKTEPEPWYGPFPASTDISIVIKGGEGNIIQEITGLTQSLRFIGEDIIFDDFNFDGYLDMRLKRWQEGAGAILATEYYWLWDIEASQFVLNEKLVEIGYAADLSVNPDTRRVEVFNRSDRGDLGHIYDYYEFHGDTYIHVYQEHYLPIYAENGHILHREIIRTDVITGETTTEIEPPHN